MRYVLLPATLLCQFPVSIQHSSTISANTVATLLLKQIRLTNAYLTLIFKGGNDRATSLSRSKIYSAAPR